MRNPQSSKESYLLIDHRAGPGMPQSYIDKTGLQLVGGKAVELATLCCAHCTGHQIKNPWRTRERGYCAKCDSFVCESCLAISREPDYVHLPWAKIRDLVLSKKAIVVGGTMGRPQILYL